MDADPGSVASGTDPRAAEVLDIVARETGVDRALLRPEATIEELGIPSLDLVQTIFAIETAFDIEIPALSPDAGTEFRTIGDLLCHVMTVLKKTRDTAA